jgi:hypothetical protein
LVTLAKALSKCIKRKLKRVSFPAPGNPPINIKFTAAFSAVKNIHLGLKSY